MPSSVSIILMKLTDAMRAVDDGRLKEVGELLHSPSFACLHGRWSPSVHTFLIAGRREGGASPLQRFAEECGSETSQRYYKSDYKNIASVYKNSTSTLQENYRRMW